MEVSSETGERDKGFTVYSWNINGIRTLNMKDVIKNLNADIVAFQETKIPRDQLDTETAFIDDYSSYFTFCRNKPGYSGVATYVSSSFTPTKSEEGLSNLLQLQMNKDIADAVGSHSSLDEFSEDSKSYLRHNDMDGRCVVTQHLVQTADGKVVPLTIFNVYCPRLRCEPGEQSNYDLKEAFHKQLYLRATKLLEIGFVLMIGDFNISHTALDVAEGDKRPNFLSGSPFREHMDMLLSKDKYKNGGNERGTFVDTFRLIYPDRANSFTCWNSKTNARENNYGSRIDYILADSELAKYLACAEIHPDILGSDHCPISATFHSLIPIASKKLPSFATKYYPEFKGVQRNIKDFFSKSVNDNPGPGKGSMPASKKSREKQLTMTSFLTKKPKLSNEEPSHPNTEIETSLVQRVPEIFPHQEIYQDNVQIGQNVSESEISIKKGDKQLTEPKDFWKELMKAPPAPTCRGHNEPCALRTVRKKGPTQGRQFWACARGTGQSNDPKANCNYFQWFSETTKSGKGK